MIRLDVLPTIVGFGRKCLFSVALGKTDACCLGMPCLGVSQWKYSVNSLLVPLPAVSGCCKS